ncbi:Ldh family oxidoreductase [Pseudochelatococcus sp. G4_1912]|uniref:Ldh family oxidoreductase n=1 Tax=Pseudochelatococcus sp. G4_1912 TaxID=3114288 RepID=UPI0039C74E70
MSDHIALSLAEAHALGCKALSSQGFSAAHTQAITDVLIAGQRDECHSHGLYRLPGVVQTLKTGKVDPVAMPEVIDHAPGVVRVDARFGFSPLAFNLGRPKLVEKARRQGIAALAINNCYHFSALWPEVEAIAAEGLVALAMTPSHSWVAPAGGKRPVFGTNPIAFAWPRPEGPPFVFDFATSAIARGDIELHRRDGKQLHEGWAIDSEGNPTTDPTAALAGAMLTFGGHKGSALAAMIELMAGPLIGDLMSAESMAYDAGAGVAPMHGELLLALDPKVFLGEDAPKHIARAETMFEAIVEQGARLPSQRRFAARAQSDANGVSIPKSLYEAIMALAN